MRFYLPWLLDATFGVPMRNHVELWNPEIAIVNEKNPFTKSIFGV